MTDQAEPADYPALARTQLALRRPGVVKKLRAIASRPVAAEERFLQFDLTWGLVSNGFVEVWPRDESGVTTTDRRPFGELFEVSPPPGQDDDPDAYATDRPAIAQLVVDALADWWDEAGGSDHSVQAVAKVEGDPLKRFDLRAREWRTDELAVMVAERTDALKARLRPQLADRLRGAIVAKLREKLTKVTQREDCHGLFAVDGENGPYRVTFQMHREPGQKSVVRSATLLTPAQLRPLLDDAANAWAGIKRDAVAEELVHELIADAWQEAGGHEFPVHALLGHVRGDDFATWDAVDRRPHTDSMGRTYRESEKLPE